MVRCLRGHVRSFTVWVALPTPPRGQRFMFHVHPKPHKSMATSYSHLWHAPRLRYVAFCCLLLADCHYQYHHYLSWWLSLPIFVECLSRLPPGTPAPSHPPFYPAMVLSSGIVTLHIHHHHITKESTSERNIAIFGHKHWFHSSLSHHRHLVLHPLWCNKGARIASAMDKTLPYGPTLNHQ